MHTHNQNERNGSATVARELARLKATTSRAAGYSHVRPSLGLAVRVNSADRLRMYPHEYEHE
eukprot:scaffold97474_cov38-Prasinocladus_malaysianus.AAC.2